MPSAKRWNQNPNQILKKWDEIFQDKVKDFPHKWTIQLVTDKPEWKNMQWEEQLWTLDEKISSAFKCKGCTHVWVSNQEWVNFYYHLIPTINSNEKKGEVIVWLPSGKCLNNKDKCSTSESPEIHVYMDEIEAVLSFLKMELGYYFYERVYTKEEEREIEQRRIKREPTKINLSIKQAQIPPLPVPAKPPTPSPALQQKSSNIRLNKWITRFDKKEETICEEWELFFRSYFDKFTEKKPRDRWVMTMEKVIKNHPLIREQKWTRFLGEKTIAGFKCECCGYVWESRRGWITFWVYQSDKLDSSGLRQGEVVVHVLGQKCAKPATVCKDPKKYMMGDLQGDEIDAVMGYLFMEVDYHFYGNDAYTDLDEKSIEEKRDYRRGPMPNSSRPHVSQNCQACKIKVCRRKITAVYPNLPKA